MVFTGAQTAALFEDNDQMTIYYATVIQIQREEIDNLNNFIRFQQGYS